MDSIFQLKKTERRIAISDPDYILTVVCKWPDSVHDSNIYRSSGVCQHLHGQLF